MNVKHNSSQPNQNTDSSAYEGDAFVQFRDSFKEEILHTKSAYYFKDLTDKNEAKLKDFIVLLHFIDYLKNPNLFDELLKSIETTDDPILQTKKDLKSLFDTFENNNDSLYLVNELLAYIQKNENNFNLVSTLLNSIMTSGLTIDKDMLKKYSIGIISKVNSKFKVTNLVDSELFTNLTNTEGNIVVVQDNIFKYGL